jgi:3-phenylpropionate/cinnamic acid dioxygenase small subunit
MDSGALVTDPTLQAEVTALLAAYGHAIDRCDADAWAALFHPEGSSAGPGRPTLRGREELRRWVVEHPRPDVLHMTTNVSVERVDGERVHVASHFLIVRADEGGAYSVMVAGSYADVLIRHESRLRFLSRVATPRVPAASAAPRSPGQM